MALNWLKASASDLGRGIGSGDIDAVELTQAYLEATATHEMAPRIYARMTKDRALAEAKAAQQRARDGLRIGLLDGVPISWKDLFDTASIVTEAGSGLLAGRVPDADAEVLENATRAGLVCLGKTHMSELAFSGLGYNPITQTPPCVNDLDAVAGGSSSGAATSVAFDMAAAGIGSDTGGSVRIPAVWNDLVGLKTTAGLVSLRGVVPLCENLDTVGPLCRSVEDAAELFAVLMADDAVDLRGADLQGRRFAVCKTAALDDLEDAPARAFEAALIKLSAAGAVIEDIEIPSIHEALALSVCLMTVEAYAQWGRQIEAEPEKMFSEIRERFEMGRTFSGVEFSHAQKRIVQLQDDYGNKTAGYDAVLMPTSPILPPNLERLQSDNDYYKHVNLLALRNTRIGNLMGLSSLTLPVGTPSCGLMMLANPFAERDLLRIGSAAENALAT